MSAAGGAAPPPPAPSAPPSSDLPALFWDEMPDDASSNPDMAAIQALIDEATPEERAVSFKEQGNRALKVGLKQRKKFYLRQAIEQYTEGLGVGGKDAAMNAILHSNRAHVHLLLGNYRNAMLDGAEAVALDVLNIKGHYRAAKGALGLRQYDKCRELASAGLGVEPANAELAALVREADEQQAKEERAAAAEAERQLQMRAPARELADALLSRGWRVGRPQFSVGDRKAVLRGTEVFWPVLFFYPEASMQSDAVEEFAEDAAFAGHLDEMYGLEAPPLPWDGEGRYRRDKVEVYYLSHGASPLERTALVEALHGGWPTVQEKGPNRYGPNSSTWVKVKEGWTLGDVLRRQDYVVPGIPVFFVLATDTPFRERFLAGDVPLL